MKRTSLLWLAIAVALAAPAFGTSIVYSNTTTDTLNTASYSATGATELGDQVQLDGTDRFARIATVQFFNAGTAGNFDAILRLFQVGAPVGSQIGIDYLVPGIVTTGGDVFNVAFDLGFLDLSTLTVPNNLIFTVALANQVGTLDLGLNLFNPPTVGSSDNSFAIYKLGGTYFTTAPDPNGNVFFELSADATTPEPATIGIVSAGLAGLALLRRRKRA